MTFVDTLFLTLVVAAFVGYGLLLFTVWLAVEVLGKPRSPAAATDKAVEAGRPLRSAA